MRQPRDVEFTIAAARAEFFLGEIVPLELKFTASGPQRFEADTRLQDRVGRMNYIEEFVAAPAEFAEDPLRGLPEGEGAMGGLSGGPVVLSEKPFTFERVLNEWVRFRRPGTYRVYVVSRRVRRDGNPIELVSNILTLEFMPPPADWVAAQIAAARDAKGALQLRFLDSPEAGKELVRRLTEGQDVGSYGAHLAVLASPYRSSLLPFMEQRLTAPDQPVWERYLDTLARLAELVASGGPMPSYPKDAAGQKAWQEEAKRRAELRRRK